MGQAKKRLDEIKALKALGKLKPAAVHESAHVIATMHFGVPIGDGGVWLKEYDDHVSGFNDAKPTQKHGNLSMGELVKNRQFFLEYQAMHYAGPLAEFFFVKGNRDPVRVFERSIEYGFWRSDFAAAMGANGDEREDKMFFNDEQFNNAGQFALRCFALLVGDATELGPILCGDENIEPLVREAVLGTGKLVRAYWQRVLNLSDVLLASPSFAMTKTRLDEWATANFRPIEAMDWFPSLCTAMNGKEFTA